VKFRALVHAGIKYPASIFLIRVWKRLSAAILIVELVVPKRLREVAETEIMFDSIELYIN
jgi:hypothetical protein